MMAPFQDCLGCHDGGAAKRWTVAGTWARGARVTITDALGKTVGLRGNDAGNFYTAEGLVFPLTVAVNGKVMPDPNAAVEPKPPARISERAASCNLCHRAEEITIEFGPEMLPGADCLGCHGPGGLSQTRFYAAGTFPPPEWPPGTTVSVGGIATTTNAVGNFYIEAPIDFATRQEAVVAGSAMEHGAPYGGCNACHVNGRAED